jgi:hypothetical protein
VLGPRAYPDVGGEELDASALVSLLEGLFGSACRDREGESNLGSSELVKLDHHRVLARFARNPACDSEMGG